jgi:hypothetical protein
LYWAIRRRPRGWPSALAVAVMPLPAIAVFSVVRDSSLLLSGPDYELVLAPFMVDFWSQSPNRFPFLGAILSEIVRFPLLGLLFSGIEWLPLAVLPALLLAWTCQRRWLWAGVLIGLSLLLFFSRVGWALWIAPASTDPLQHYSWDGWYMTCFVAAYGAGAVMLAALLLRPVMRWVGRQIRAVIPRFRMSSRPRPSPAE